MSEPRVFGRVDEAGELTGETWEHLFTVLRVRPQSVVRLVGGDGYEVRARVRSAARRRGQVDVLERLALPAEPAVRVTLMLGVLKGDQMDAVIQAGTELGVGRFVPMVTERSVGRGSEGRIERWRRIARSAMAQCGRGYEPVVSDVVSFADAVAESKGQRTLIFWERCGSGSWRESLVETSSVCVMVGPEGGFSEAEVQQALQAGGTVASLGARILRAQTAAMLAPALVLHETGGLV